MADDLQELRDRMERKRMQLMRCPRWRVGSPWHTGLVDEVERLRGIIRTIETNRKYLIREMPIYDD